MCQQISVVALALVGTMITVYNIMHTVIHNIQEIKLLYAAMHLVYCRLSKRWKIIPANKPGEG